MNTHKSLRGVLAMATLIGCGSDFDPGSRVTDFRLIAVQADKPYAAPGEDVELRTLAYEPFGRPVTWAWATCVAPRDTTINACLAKMAEDAQASGRAPTMSVGQDPAFRTTIPANVLDGVTPGVAGNVWVGVVTIACPGSLSLGDTSNWRSGEVPFRCADANTREDLPYERFVVSVKRIYVRHRDRNQNPAPRLVTWDGTPWAEDDVKEVAPCTNSPSVSYADCDGGEEHELDIPIAPESVEAGTDELGAPFSEDIVAQYYATEGLFEFDVRTRTSSKTSWKGRASARGKEHTLWFVTRDNRGGVGWTSRRVRVK